MSTIENAVHEALRSAGHGDYIRYADQPIAALTEREGDIAQGIISAAVDQGMDASDVRDLLADLGMFVPAPVTVTQAETPETFGGTTDVEGTLAQIQQTLQAILRAAADNGITIPRV